MAPAREAPGILLAFANDRRPDGTFLPGLTEERRRLREVLEKGEEKRLCRPYFYPDASLSEILSAFQDRRKRISIFHFAGHGDPEHLFFEASAGTSGAAHASPLAAFLGEQRSLVLVFLNSCATRGQVEALLDAGVAAVIATSQRIGDELAVDFSHRFYQALVGGSALQSAYDQARHAVATEWGGQVREAYYSDLEDLSAQSLDPWVLHFKRGAEKKKDWTLALAAGDYLDGLPLPSMDLPAQPFKNLAHFTRADAPIFFGRGRQIREIYEALVSESGEPILLLYGAAGVGKSSLLAAGLLPRLTPAFAVEYRRTPAGLRPAKMLAEVFGGAQDIGRAWCDREREQPLVVILDQLEETWSRLDGARFGEVLQQIFRVRELRPKGRLILGFRQEVLAEMRDLLEEATLPFRPLPIWPLDRQGVIEAVTGAASYERYRLSFEEELPERLADFLLQDPESVLAPTLQILLWKMWGEVKDEASPHFNQALFSRLRRGGKLLDQFFEEQLTTLTERHRELLDSGLVLDLLAFHISSAGMSATRSREAVLERYGESREAEICALLKSCQEQFLLSESAEPLARGTTRLVHDVLVELVRSRYAESDRPGQRAEKILANRRPDWVESKGGPVLDQADLKTVLVGREGMRRLDPIEERIISESQREQRRRLLRSKAMRISLGVSFLVVTVMAFVAAIQGEIADVRRLAAESINIMDTNLDRSLLLSMAALDRKSLLQARRSLVMALSQNPFLETSFHFHKIFVRDVQVSPDGSFLASTSRDGAVALWDAKTHALLAELPVKGTRARSGLPLAFSPDSRLLAYSDKGYIRVWDIYQEALVMRDGSKYHYLQEGPEKAASVVSLQFVSRWSSPSIPQGSEGAVLVATWGEGPVSIWDSKGWNSIPPLALPIEGEFTSSDIAVEEGLWVIGSSELGASCEQYLDRLPPAPSGSREVDRCGCISIWDLEASSLVAGPNCIANAVVWSVDYDPGTGRVASGWGDRVLRLWEVGEGRLELLDARSDHGGSVNEVAFGPNGTHLASVSSDARVLLWDLSTEKLRILQELRGQGAEIASVAFFPDGDKLLTGGGDGRLYLWKLDASRGETFLPSTHGQGCCFFLTHGEERLLSFDPIGEGVRWTESSRMIEWDISNTGAPRRVGERVLDHRINAVAMDRKQKILATGGADGYTRFWDTETFELLPGTEVAPRSGKGPPRRVRAIAFSPTTDWVVVGLEGSSSFFKTSVAEGPIRFPHQTTLFALRFSPDGSLLAGLDGQGNLVFWEAETWHKLQTIRQPTLGGGLQFSPDGQRLAVRGRSAIRIYDLEDRRFISRGSFDFFPELVRTMTFDRSGKRLLATFERGSIFTWNLESMQREVAPLVGHTATVMALAILPHSGLVSADGDGKMIYWSRDPRVPLRQAVCSMANRNLSPEEWREHMGFWSPYQRICPDQPVDGATRRRSLEGSGR